MKALAKLFLGMFLLLVIQPSYAQTDKQAAEEKAWKEYMTPGKEHQLLAKSDGEWTEELTMWMEPGTEPSKSTATAESKMILEGRYQQMTHKGTFNGMPFQGIGITGYDNAKKVFFSTWIDNMGTGIMYSEGKWKDADKTIEYKGKSIDPVSGIELSVRQIIKIIDDNNQTVEMFTTVKGKEYKSMEIKLSRKK